MTDAREPRETTRRELKDVIISDTGGTEGEEQGSLVWHEETVSDDIPPSLLSYFETSKSRAAVCEQFILAELEDLTASHHTEDTMNFNHELDKDMMQLDMKVTCETENKENLLTPKEAEELFSHIVSVCPDSEDEAETDEHMGREGDPEWEASTAKRLAREEEMKRSSESQGERRERRRREETKTEERRRQTQRDFQEELNKLMEAEKRHQREVELMERRAQEKIEQEFLLQQELISNLQERVKEERRRREEEEEEQKRMKEEGEKKRKEEEEERKKKVEDRRKKEAETLKREMERRKMQEEMRRKKEDEEKRMIEEVKLREKHRRKKEEEQRRKEEEEKRRKEEKERAKREEETNKIREDVRKREEERKRKEIRLKEEETRRRMEEEERKRKENEEKVKERENNRESEEVKVEKIMAKKKMEEEKGRKNAEEIGLKEEIGKKEEEDRRNSAEEDERRGEEVRITEELEVRVNEEEEERISEEETRKVEVGSMMEREEEENGETGEMPVEEEEKGLSVECRDKRKKEENTTKEEEQGKWQAEEMSRRKEEEEKTNIEKEVLDWTEAYETDDGKVEHESKTKDDLIPREDARRNIVAEVDMRKNTEENLKTEERKVKEEEERTNIRVRDAEEERRLGVQEKKGEKDSMKSQNGSENTEDTGHSQLETVSAPNQPRPGHSPGESTASPTCSHAPQQLDPNDATSVDARDAEVNPCTSPAPSPACLPERTEQKRLSWMKECVPWSKLSLQNKSKQKGRVRSRRGPSRTAGPGSLPPLGPQTLLQSAGRKSLQEVTTVTLEDLPGCSLVTLAQCARLQSLTLRRCGLRSLEGVNQLPQLCHIDVQENHISFVDCENMSGLRVLRLGHNKLTSIHGLSGADNLDVLDVSHNSISRIAGLESARRLQWLSLGHNQLISTKGLRDVYTLLHLDCSHNHLARVEGLENSALLHTLDLRSNSLTEPPSLDNHVLLRELQLDDNSVSSLRGLAVRWLPLLHRLSAAQNRITLLPSMSDFVSLASLDLRFNCMSELHNVCESAAGCQFLREVHLTGNPLQQESGWRSTLQKAAAGLRAIDGEETDSPAARWDGSASGSFLTFCRAQLEQTRDLQRRHRRELSNASSPLDALKSSCRHFSETLKLAVDQRFAHEYGDTDVSAGQTTLEETVDMDGASGEKLAEHSEMKSAERVPPVFPNGVSVNCSSWNLKEKSPWESVGSVQKTGPHLLTEEESTSSHLEMAPVSNHQDLDPKSTGAVVIQRRWREYRQKCGNISSPPTAEEGGGRGGDEGKPEWRPSCVDGSAVGQDYAASIIQASWRGFALRRRLASALAAVTSADSGEDGAFEEVDMDGFDFDEAALEKHWSLPLSEDSSSRHSSVSEQPLRLKPPGLLPDPPQHTLPPTPLWRPKQAWVAVEQMDSSGQRASPDSSNRSKSASASVLSGLSARSEQILEEWGFSDSKTALLMLKRAQKMGSKKPKQNKHRDPSDCLALFRNQRSPVEAQNRPAPPNRCHLKVFEAELGPQPEERTEQVKRERAQQWLCTQSDRDSESERFLPEISSVILNGGRVQLVADPGYTEHLHHASGLWASSSSSAAQPSKESNDPHRNSVGRARKDVPSPERVKSAPSKKERISFRDNPVQLSGGWGGGRKRDNVYK